MTGVSVPERIPSSRHAGEGRDYEQIRNLLRLRAHLISAGLHESRGALVALRGYSKLLLEGEAGPANDTQKEYLEIIAANAHKLATLLATLGRLASNQELHLEECNFRELWATALAALAVPISAKSIRLRASVPHRRLWITADPVKLGSAIHSILDHAISRLPEGCELIATVSTSEDHLKVYICDPRIGLPHSSVGEPGANSAVEDVIRLHGGSFSVSEAPGEGQTVTFTLPLLQEEADEDRRMNG